MLRPPVEPSPCTASSFGKHLAKPKTNGSRRSMPVPPEPFRVLSEQLDAARDIVSPLGLVFPWIDGGLLHPSRGSKRDVRRVPAKPRLRKNFRLDDLRHTCATLMRGNGARPEIVAERLGRSTAKLALPICGPVRPV